MPSVATWSLTIAGTDRTSLVARKSLKFTHIRGSRGTLTCDIETSVSDNTAFRPALDQEVKLTINGTVVFGGFITNTSDQPIAGMRGGTKTTITVGSYDMMLDRAYVTHSFVAGSSLHDVVSWVVTNILSPDYGITLDPSMLTGGTFNGPLAFDGTQNVTAVWTQLMLTTGWITRIDPATKIVYWFAPGTKTSPFSLSSSNCNSPVPWQLQRDVYANIIQVLYGPSGPLAVSDSFTGDGVTTSWPLTYSPPATDPTTGFIVSAGYVNDPAGSTTYSPIGRYGIDPLLWTWNAADNTLHRSSALGLGVVASFGYTAVFPQSAIAQDSVDIAAKGPWQIPAFQMPQIINKATALQLATGILARAEQAPRKLQATTLAGLSFPGDAMTLSFPHRTVTGTWTVDQVTVTMAGPGVFSYAYQFTEGTNATMTWADFIRALTGNSVTGASATIVAGSYIAPSPIVLTSPTNMGGASNESVPNASTKTLIPNAAPYVARASFSGLLRYNLKSRSGNPVRIVISDGTTDTNGGTVTSTSFADYTLPVSIVIGHTYRVYVQYTSGADEPYCGYAQLDNP